MTHKGRTKDAQRTHEGRSNDAQMTHKRRCIAARLRAFMLELLLHQYSYVCTYKSM